MTTFIADVSTGIYCRPGCSAPDLERRFATAAGAEVSGFRACDDCRPYRAPLIVGSDVPELVCQAVQMVLDGALDDGTEADLAARIGLSPRHLRRVFATHLGATPDQLARSRRAHFARGLLDDTDLSIVDVAFAAGFGSLRQFNRMMRDVFGASPTELRDRRHDSDRLVVDGGLDLLIAVPPGYDWAAVRDFLAVRAMPGVETVDSTTYRRTIVVDGATGLLEISPVAGDELRVRAHLPYWGRLMHIIERTRRLIGIGTDHQAAVAALSADPALGAVVRRRPGLAVPGTWDPLEVGMQAILGRSRDIRATRRSVAAVVAALGTPVHGLPGALTHAFPESHMLTFEGLTAAGLPPADAAAVAALASTAPPLGHHTGIDRSAVADEHVYQLLSLRLGHRDAFPMDDPALRAGLVALGIDESEAMRWRPWSSLAAVHLMAHGDRLTHATH